MQFHARFISCGAAIHPRCNPLSKDDLLPTISYELSVLRWRGCAIAIDVRLRCVTSAILLLERVLVPEDILHLLVSTS
jgi:hypothetical protein